MFGRRREASELESLNLLEVAPFRAAEWSEKEGRVVVVRPRPARGLRAFGEWLSWCLSSRHLRLDEIGTFAWLGFDGQRRVGEVASSMRREFGDRIEPAEERLGHFVRQLRREGLLGYPEVDSRPGPQGC